MSDVNSVVLGFDPGGMNHFGWSVCPYVDGELQPPVATGVANHASDAMTRTRDNIPTRATVLAAGIDAPLFWTKTAHREIDGVLRSALTSNGFPPHAVGGTVQEVNSLQGACIAQGPLLARLLVETWGVLPISESHPKALRYLVGRIGQPDVMAMVNRLIAQLGGHAGHDHRRDATLAAVSAWAAIGQNPPGWRNLYAEEPNPIPLFGIPVSYWMPGPVF